MIRLPLVLLSLIALFSFSSDGDYLTIGTHDEAGYCVVFHPDNNILASGGNDNKIFLWDVAKQQQVKSFVAHSVGVSDLVFSPDGKHLISAGMDKVIKVWDCTTWKLYKTLSGHGKQVLSLAISPDGQYLYSGGDDQKIIKWNLNTYAKEGEKTGPSERVLSLDISGNGKYLVATGGNRVTKTTGNLQIWTTVNFDISYTLEEETYAIQDAKLSNGGTLLLYAGNFSEAILMKWKDNKVAAKMAVTDFSINAVILDGIQGYFGSGFNGEVVSWKVGQPKAAEKRHEKDVNDLSLSGDKKHLASIGSDGKVVVKNMVP